LFKNWQGKVAGIGSLHENINDFHNASRYDFAVNICIFAIIDLMDSKPIIKRGLLTTVGYFLSPFSWWNDLLAAAFGKCSIPAKKSAQL